MPIVDVPGIGEIEFPDGMSNEEMGAVIKRQYFSGQQAVSNQPQSQPTQQPDMMDPMAASMGMFSPTQIGKTAVDYAPEIGIMAGGMAPFPANIPAAGIGYAAGKMFQGAMQGKPPASPVEDVKNLGMGSAMEVGGNLMAKGTSKLLGLGLDKINQGFSMLRAGQLANKGLPIPASSINPAEAVTALANKARQTYPANKVVRQAHEKLRQGADEMLSEFKTKFGVDGITKEAVDSAFNDWAATMGGSEAPLSLPQSLQIIQDTMGKPFVSTAGPRDSGRWWVKEAQTFLENPTVQGLRDIWSTIGGGKGADKTARQKLLSSITTEVKELYGDEAAQMLDFAKSQSSWWKKIGPLQGILKQSYSTVDGVDTFMPDKFARLWEQARNKYFVKKMTRDELAQVDEFAQFMGVIGNELKQKVSDKGPMSLLGQSGAGSVIAGGLKMAGMPGGEVAAGLGLALPGMQYLLSRQAGKVFQPGSSVYRQAMGEPMDREIIPGLVNIGGKIFLLEGNKLLESK